RDERDVELGLDQAGAVALELEIGVPGHDGDRAQEEGVGVVQEAARICERAQAAACRRATLDGKRLQAGLAEIGLQDESVMPGAKDNAVVSGHGICRQLVELSSPRKRGSRPWSARRDDIAHCARQQGHRYLLRRRAIDSALFSSLATGRVSRSLYALRTAGLSEIARVAGFS